MTTTLTGYRPRVGDIVTQQMYDPMQPSIEATIEERVRHGHTYGPERPGMIVVRVDEGHQDVSSSARWTLEHPKGSAYRNAQWPYSTVEDDWCVLTLEQPAELDLFDGGLLA